jgi:hypothetical protein
LTEYISYIEEKKLRSHTFSLPSPSDPSINKYTRARLQVTRTGEAKISYLDTKNN